MDKVGEAARKYALQNALFYNGKANEKAVLGKVLQEIPEMRGDVNRVRQIIKDAVIEVNKMKLEEQRKELEETAPELLVKEEKEQGLPELPNAVLGDVTTRFAPAPTGPLHIGHITRAVMLSWLYAKKYKGRFLVRLEDTDAKKVQEEYYGMIKKDLRSVGVEWDGFFLSSDYMDDYYRLAEELLKKEAFYICTCSQTKFQNLKVDKKGCPCRDTGDWEMKWKAMLGGQLKEGEAVVRLKTSMSHKNPALRDPPMLRISHGKHPLLGERFSVWPLYNFAAVITDHLERVSHVFRAKEHEHNTAVQDLVYEALDWKKPTVINFGMVYLPGDKSHTRDIKSGIESGKYSGWDDIKLHTIRAFLRRGYQPETFKELAEISGLSKTDIRLSWENLEGVNRKYIDPIADRYMVVVNPVETVLQKGPDVKEVEVERHPTKPERGKKKMPVTENIWLSNDDFKMFQGQTIRLKGLCNISLGKKSVCTGNEIEQKMQKLQWVSEPHTDVEIVTPEGTLRAIGEQELGKAKKGSVIQMERVGFGKVDSVSESKVVVWFAHK